MRRRREGVEVLCGNLERGEQVSAGRSDPPYVWIVDRLDRSPGGENRERRRDGEPRGPGPAQRGQRGRGEIRPLHRPDRCSFSAAFRARILAIPVSIELISASSLRKSVICVASRAFSIGSSVAGGGALALTMFACVASSASRA